ncbi:MAG: sigma-70 family RNA polymerase sigma factor [Verrucomicrobiota bacterium]
MEKSADIYPNTRWTVVAHAVAPDSVVCRRALGDLFNLYNYPVYCCIRRRGLDHHDAQDLAQEYFVSLLEREYLAEADPRKGKFRAFIQADLKLFLNNAHRKKHTLKRGGGVNVFSLDAAKAEHDYEASCGTSLDPDSVLDREWAKATFAAALVALKQRYVATNSVAVFETLSPLLDKPSRPGMYEAAASQLGMQEATVKVAMTRLRERLGRALEQVVADTLDDPTPAAIKDEIRYLFTVLAAS